MAEPRPENLLTELEPLIANLGYRIVECDAGRVKRRLQVRLILYKDGGVGIDDCVRVHKLLYPRLEMMYDREDVALEVTSPGITRTFKSLREYDIFRGHPVRILPEDSSDWIRGIIREVEDGRLMLEDPAGDVREWDLRAIRKGKLDY